MHAKKIQKALNFGAIDVKMDGSVLEYKSSFKMLGLTFCSNFICLDSLSLDLFYEVSFS